MTILLILVLQEFEMEFSCFGFLPLSPDIAELHSYLAGARPAKLVTHML